MFCLHKEFTRALPEKGSSAVEWVEDLALEKPVEVSEFSNSWIEALKTLFKLHLKKKIMKEFMI